MKQALLAFAALLFLAAGVAIIVVGMNYGRSAVEVRPLAIETDADKPPPPRAKKDVPKNWLGEFTLTERGGKEFSSEKMMGKVWAASFFFADCPYQCHQQNLSIASFQKEFGPKGVTFVSITCNPKTDTPERLQTYARTYTKSATEWLFLTGDLIYIRRVGAEYFGVPVDEGTHGSRLILVDKWGNLRGYYSTDGRKSPEEYAKIAPKLKELLAEKEPPAKFQVGGSKGGHENAEPMKEPTTTGGEE